MRSCSGRHSEEGGRHLSLATMGFCVITLHTLQLEMSFGSFFYLEWKVHGSSIRNWLLWEPERRK